MSQALIGFISVVLIIHLILIAVPLRDTLRSGISTVSKTLWCLFLLLLPIVGAVVFHYRFRSGLYHGPAYERSAAEERAASGTLAPDDRD